MLLLDSPEAIGMIALNYAIALNHMLLTLSLTNISYRKSEPMPKKIQFRITADFKTDDIPLN